MKRQTLTKQTTPSRHFLSVNKPPAIMSFLFFFFFHSQVFTFVCMPHALTTHSSVRPHALNNSKMSKQGPDWLYIYIYIYILTDFSKRRTIFYVNYLLQVCLTNTTLFTSLNQPCPSWSLMIHNASMLFVQLLHDVQFKT